MLHNIIPGKNKFRAQSLKVQDRIQMITSSSLGAYDYSFIKNSISQSIVIDMVIVITILTTIADR